MQRFMRISCRIVSFLCFATTADAHHSFAMFDRSQVTLQLHPLRDGSYGGQLVSVTLPSGKVLGQHAPGTP